MAAVCGFKSWLQTSNLCTSYYLGSYYRLIPHPTPENTWGAATFRSKCPSSAFEGRTGKVSEIPIHVGDSLNNEDIVVVVLPLDSIVTWHHLHFLCHAKKEDFRPHQQKSHCEIYLRFQRFHRWINAFTILCRWLFFFGPHIHWCSTLNRCSRMPHLGMPRDPTNPTYKIVENGPSGGILGILGSQAIATLFLHIPGKPSVQFF